MFIYNKPKAILRNIASFAIVVFPWFLWNFIFYGNWFTGFIDGYAQNISLRQAIMPLNINDILAVSSYYTIPAILGILLSFFFIFSSKKEYKFTITIISLFTAILIWNYSTIPTKFPRYLFNLLIPIAFFSSIFLIFAISNLKRWVNVIGVVLGTLFTITLLTAFITTMHETKYALPFQEAADDIKQLNLEDCEILSPHWVPVTYYTDNVYPLEFNSVTQAIEKNKTILIFTKERTPDDSFTEQDLQQLPILKMTDDYVFYARSNIQEACSPKYLYNAPYIEDHCSMIAKAFPFLMEQIKSVCYSINRNP